MEMNSMEDWEQWVKLYRENPERFERERRAAIEDLIMSQPEQIRHRSRQLQWRIDAVRRRAPNSLAACVQLHEMLMDAVYGPGGLIDVVNGGNGRLFLKGGNHRRLKTSGVCLKLPDRRG